jgi:hypothetical protein
MVNPWQTSNENTKEDDVLSKKTKTSCEDDFLSLVDEEIESINVNYVDNYWNLFWQGQTTSVLFKIRKYIDRLHMRKHNLI